MGWQWFTAPFWMAAIVVLVVRLTFLAAGAEYTEGASEMTALAASMVGVGALVVVAIIIVAQIAER
jgi:hypothetical protein